MDHVVQIAMLVPLAFACWQDLLLRRIPDGVAAVMALAGIFLRLRDGFQPLGVSLAVAAVLFAVLFAVYLRRSMGGGDVKLMVALALGYGPLTLVGFLFATALAGGVLALAYLALRLAALPPRPARHDAPLLRRLWAVERWRAHRSGLPYGIAIAAGAAWTMLPALGR
jgi:prepilin peptidase CpaA